MRVKMPARFNKNKGGLIMDLSRSMLVQGLICLLFVGCHGHSDPAPRAIVPEPLEVPQQSLGTQPQLSEQYLQKPNSYVECLAESGRECRLREGSQSVLVRENLAPRFYEYSVRVKFECQAPVEASHLVLQAHGEIDSGLETEVILKYAEDDVVQVRGAGDLRLEDRDPEGTRLIVVKPGCALNLLVLGRQVIKSAAELQCESESGKEWIGGSCFPKLKTENVLFRTDDHCQKADDADRYVVCQAIPRPGLPEISIDAEATSPTTVKSIQDLAFTSELRYINYCPVQLPTYASLKTSGESFELNQDQKAIIRTIRTHFNPSTGLKFEFTLDAAQPSLISFITSYCITALTENITTLDLNESNVDALKAALQSDPIAGKAWLESELARIKGRDSYAYQTLLKSLLGVD